MNPAGRPDPEIDARVAIPCFGRLVTALRNISQAE